MGRKYKVAAHKCPKCGADIRWTCSGKTGYAYCANSLIASRVFTLDTVHTMPVCDWEGRCERRPDGNVEIYYYNILD